MQISVNGATDELVISELDVHGVTDPEWRDSSALVPWRQLLGTPLFSAWTLRSHTGAADAAQFEFCWTVNDNPRLVRVQGMASTLHVLAVTALRLKQPPRRARRVR